MVLSKTLKLSKAEKTFLFLLRSTICNLDVKEGLPSIDPEVWDEVYKLSEKNGLLAVTFGTLNKIIDLLKKNYCCPVKIEKHKISVRIAYKKAVRRFPSKSKPS